jgi:tetratricopeptide (TPR) repeat protein
MAENLLEKLNFSEEEKKVWDRVVESSKNDDWQAVTKGILELLNTKPNSSILLATLANAYWELNEIEKAENLFRKSATLDPKWDKPSLGVYHVLRDQNRIEEAIMEALRFLSNSPSDDFDNLMQTLFNYMNDEDENREGKLEYLSISSSAQYDRIFKAVSDYVNNK